MWFHRRLLIHLLQLLHFTINYYLLEIALCGVGTKSECMCYANMCEGVLSVFI